MCRLWGRIRYGVRWDPVDKAELALKAFSLKDIRAVDIRFDPFHGDSKALREFWYKLSLPKVRETNPKVRVQTQINSDGQPPQFIAHLHDGRQLLFKTDGFHLSDMLMHLNRLLGLPALGLRGAPEGEEEAEGVDERLLEVHLRDLKKRKSPADFLS